MNKLWVSHMNPGVLGQGQGQGHTSSSYATQDTCCVIQTLFGETGL